MSSESSRLLVSRSAAAALTCLATLCGPWVAPAAHADPTVTAPADDVLSDIYGTANDDHDTACKIEKGTISYHYSHALEDIAQQYARDENPDDLNHGNYMGQKIGFLGSGDPMAAALTSAYKRGAGNIIRDCHTPYRDIGVGFIRHEDRSVDVVTIVFGVPSTPTRVEQRITGQCSPPNGQDCNAQPSVHFAANTDSRVFIEFTSDPQGCADSIFHIFVDGKEQASSKKAPGETLTTGALLRQSGGGHDVSVRATGIAGGCNNGTLSSWGGTLVVGAAG